MNNNQPIRILQCVSNMDRAGIETMLMNFYRNIDRDIVQFDFLCNKTKPGDYDEEIKSLGGKIYVSPGLNPFKWFKYQKYMKKLFSEHPEYKIIHCQNEAMGFPALYAAKKAGIKVRIAHSHNTTTRFDLKWPIKIMYKYLLRTVATDYAACGIAAGSYLFGKEVRVINNAIDTDKFIFDEKKRNEIRNKFNLNDKFVIGHVGRFEPQKNHSFIIDVFYNYQKINPNTILLLIGNGSLQDKMISKVKKMNIQDKVLFLGNISNVSDFYQAIDVFILPSFHEGLPVVGIEAQTSGLKCLFSDAITRESDITGNVDFLSINNYETWINALGKVTNYKRKNMKKSIIKNGYDINTEVNKLEKYYIDYYNKNKKI